MCVDLCVRVGRGVVWSGLLFGWAFVVHRTASVAGVIWLCDCVVGYWLAVRPGVLAVGCFSVCSCAPRPGWNDTRGLGC